MQALTYTAYNVWSCPQRHAMLARQWWCVQQTHHANQGCWYISVPCESWASTIRTRASIAVQACACKASSPYTTQSCTVTHCHTLQTVHEFNCTTTVCCRALNGGVLIRCFINKESTVCALIVSGIRRYGDQYVDQMAWLPCDISSCMESMRWVLRSCTLHEAVTSSGDE